MIVPAYAVCQGCDNTPVVVPMWLFERLEDFYNRHAHRDSELRKVLHRLSLEAAMDKDVEDLKHGTR